MQTIGWSVILLGACFTPVWVACFGIRRWRQQWRSRAHTPFKELRYRPAGEALRLKLAFLDDKFLERVYLLIGLPLAIYLGCLVFQRLSWLIPALAFAASLASTLVVGRGLRRVLRERDQYQLGYDGERYVGEELNRLIAAGFEVYHDVPFDGFNIDHVLVGPQGVFAVETKTRRKPVDKSGTKEYRVIFDGHQLQWTWGADGYGLEQAANNARTLSQWLTSAVGESVPVTAILTLPGWMVDRKAPPTNVYVTNPKEIAKVWKGNEVKFTDTFRRRICHQLNQKCRIAIE